MKHLALAVSFVWLLCSGCAHVPAVAPAPATLEVSLYFVDQGKFDRDEMPFWTPVQRQVEADGNVPEQTLRALWAGPSAQETERGLTLTRSHITGFRKVEQLGNVVSVYLEGPCDAQGMLINAAGHIGLTLNALPGVDHVVIYDEAGETAGTDLDSAPQCLQP